MGLSRKINLTAESLSGLQEYHNMARKKNTKNKETLYGIIGLGRFGFALAQSLAESGKEILVIDREQDKINAAAAFTDNAFCIDNLTRENLETVGIADCDIVVVAIGEQIDTSILTTLTVLRLAIGEMLYFRDIPVAATINEAVELAKKYSMQEDAAYINGVLGAFAKANRTGDEQ